MGNEIFITTKQLCERWQIQRRAIEYMRSNGKGVPFVRIGNSIRYSLQDVIKFENERKLVKA